MSALLIVVALVATGTLCSTVGHHVAQRRAHHPVVGAALGYLLGPVGLIVLVLLPRGSFQLQRVGDGEQESDTLILARLLSARRLMATNPRRELPPAGHPRIIRFPQRPDQGGRPLTG